MAISNKQINEHFEKLGALPLKVEVARRYNEKLSLSDAFNCVIDAAQNCTRKSGGGKMVFIGNGGSAAIASHMATDFTKNGGIRAIAFNDASLLTCYGNDFGYANALAKAVEHYVDAKDILVAISSSGMSENIINACEVAAAKCGVITLSGFRPDNELRKLGDINFYVPAHDYGSVEITHLALLHAILDMHMGIS